ncbi:putative naringenin-chalcone synthase [Sphingomonas jinjuensis]|uniref:Putative naringenin-chalcone synthase n=1 Tax=Sphingomonas jinjuensis TaxID=535907 RepID=A0A840F3Z9_9SPHN|nr:type III polyketide synthase [Sphingomonas jinjuensis]MBB4152570.1 putative naringenin-chalcone synthase [Sphingomonas jinjuensis]
MPSVFLNSVATATPTNDIHALFVDWASAQIETRQRPLFERMAARSGIERRWSVLPDPLAADGFYATGMPGTAARMAIYADAAPTLALAAIERLGDDARGITHLVVASCTGFVAPGIDQIIAARLGLDPGVERILIGFMGCYAAVAAMRTARHIVRSEADARVLVVTVELSTLHLQETADVEPLLAMLQFGDGAAAAIVSAEPRGIEIGAPFAAALPASAELIRWTITDRGFAMHLDGAVPRHIGDALSDPAMVERIAGGRDPAALVWAVHAGGRSILEAVERALGLPGDALDRSRAVLRRAGNMSSATLMFVLADLLAARETRDGVAIAFGPGLAAEGFAFGPVR